MKFANKRSMMDRKSTGMMERKAERKAAEELATQYEAEDQDSETELPAALKSFKERNASEKARFKDATDSECFVAITFATRAEKDAFIAEFGLIDHPLIPGTPGNKYVNGPSWAAALRKRFIS